MIGSALWNILVLQHDLLLTLSIPYSATLYIGAHALPRIPLHPLW
jgi:hypothetical protein